MSRSNSFVVVVEHENPNGLATIPALGRMRFGLSTLALVLFGCTTAASSAVATIKAPPPLTTSMCTVEMSIESPRGEEANSSRVNLGVRACEEKRTVVVSRAGAGAFRSSDRTDSYFIAMSLSGTTDHPIVTSDVLALSPSTSDVAANGDSIADVFMRNMPPMRDEPKLMEARANAVRNATSKPSAHAITPGEWNEIAHGEWPDATPYRVLVRVVTAAT